MLTTGGFDATFREVLPALMAPDATVEELAEVLASARTLGMDAVFHMGITWDPEAVADFVAVLFSDMEEAYGLLDVELAFDYKRVSSCLCRLMRTAGVQPTTGGVLQMARLCKEALPVSCSRCPAQSTSTRNEWCTSQTSAPA